MPMRKPTASRAKSKAARASGPKPKAQKRASGTMAKRAARPAALPKPSAWGSSDELLQFIETSPDILIRFDREARILFVTKNIERYSGIPAKKYIGKRYRDLGYPAHRYEMVERAMSQAFDTGAANEASVKLDWGGRDYVFNWRLVPERKKGRKRFDTVLCIGRNITDSARAEEALKISQERAANFITQSHEAIYCVEFDSPIDTSLPMEEQIKAIYDTAYFTEANEAMARIYGMPSASMFIGMRLKDILGDAANSVNRSLIEKSIQSGYKISDNETEVVGPDGSQLYFISSNVGIVEGGMLVRFWGSAVDVTKMKETERRLHASLKEKEILLKEIHHRVKNNLSVISGLLSLHEDYAHGAQERAIFDDLASRINAMALIHDRLYRSDDMSAVDFREFVESLVMDLASAYRVDHAKVGLDVEMDDSQVSIRKAVPCGQILNELISNCLKHAFKRGEKGLITVRLKHCAGAAGRVCLSVTDNGPGFKAEGFDPASAPTLGLRLVYLLAEQLGGRVLMQSNGGASVAVEFPAGV